MKKERRVEGFELQGNLKSKISMRDECRVKRRRSRMQQDEWQFCFFAWVCCLHQHPDPGEKPLFSIPEDKLLQMQIQQE